METPNILFWDSETSPLLATVWGLGKQEVGYKQIRKEREVICIGYAWNDGPVQIISFDQSKFDINARDDDADKEMLGQFSRLSASADLMVGHNLTAFDVGAVRSRLIKHQLPDLAPTLIGDTYIQTKGIGFTSHKLDYLTKYLGIGEKEEHPYELWLDVMDKKDGALENMKKYCMGDVENNRTLHNRLKPYIQSPVNLAVFNGDNGACPHCGTAGKLVARKYKYTLTGKRVQYQCAECGKYSTSGRNEIKRSSYYLR